MHADELATLKALNEYADWVDQRPATLELVGEAGWKQDHRLDKEFHHPDFADLALTSNGTLYWFFEVIAENATMGQVRMMGEVLKRPVPRSY